MNTKASLVVVVLVGLVNNTCCVEADTLNDIY